MRTMIFLSCLALVAACTATPDETSQRLVVADLCIQAGNAESALATVIRAGKLTPAQVDQVEAAKIAADTICLDQETAATSQEYVARLRTVVPTLVGLLVKE